MHRISGTRVIRKFLLGFVDYDARFEAVRFRDDQKAVEHATMRFGFCRREHDHDLIDVGGNDALALTFARRAAGKLRLPRRDLADRPMTNVRIRLDNDAVADRELLQLVGFFLEASTQRSLDRLTRSRANVPDSACTFQDDAFDLRQLLPSRRIASHQVVSLDLAPRMSASSVAFASLSFISPMLRRTSSSFAPKARNSVSRCPVATGSPPPQRTKRRYAANGRSFSPLSSATISTL